MFLPPLILACKSQKIAQKVLLLASADRLYGGDTEFKCATPVMFSVCVGSDTRAISDTCSSAYCVTHSPALILGASPLYLGR